MVAKIRTIETTPFEFNMEKVNPLFSKSKIYVMYHGKNRNKSRISKDAVERNLSTIKNIPIIGEFSSKDGEGNFKGHGGKIEITDGDIKYVHTTRPIGVIPESAKVYWEVVKDNKDIEREYLVVDGAYLWNRYEEEVMTLKDNNFGQSMELEVFDGEWNDADDLYEINDFAFSGLCILGINKNGEGHVEPAFEDAKIITYSLDKESFKKEFSQMLSELNFSVTKEKTEQDKEVDTMLKELLEKYSLTVEDLTAKGIDFNEISEDDIEAKIIEVFNITVEDDQAENEGAEGEDEGDSGDTNPEDNAEGEDDPDNEGAKGEDNIDVEALNARITELEEQNNVLTEEVEGLREFKLNVEKADHEAKVTEMFSNFQLSEEDVKDLDIHAFSLEVIEEKCYAILGKKLASKKNFSKSKDEDGIKLPVNSKDEEQPQSDGYADLFDKYNK